MAVAKEEILEAIANMTVMEIVDLISAMEQKFGVSAAAAAVVAAPAVAPAAAAAEEQTEFNVVMTSFGSNKVAVIKVIRPREKTDAVTPEELIRYAWGLPHVATAVIGMDSLDVLDKDIALAGRPPLDAGRLSRRHPDLRSPGLDPGSGCQREVLAVT